MILTIPRIDSMNPNARMIGRELEWYEENPLKRQRVYEWFLPARAFLRLVEIVPDGASVSGLVIENGELVSVESDPPARKDEEASGPGGQLSMFWPSSSKP
jgi:hypothetical protein